MDDHFNIGFGAVFRFVKGIVKDLLYDIACYAVGWIILRVLTLGRYPDESLTEGIKNPESSESIPCIVGLVALFVVVYFLFS